jgi:alpha-beta hydrolase superfamily lysophospholipase
MTTATEWTFQGVKDTIVACSWPPPADGARFVAVLVHGYGEHIGRYGHVADSLASIGGAVYGVDHLGHGKSGGERVLIANFDDVVQDVHNVVETARADHPGLPVVLVGHSMGGMIGARYAQVHGDVLDAVVLSGAAIGSFDLIHMLLSLDELPDIPLDPSVLSRDEAVGAAYAADELVWHGPFKRPTLQGFADTIAAIDAHGSLGHLPLMWVHGEDDQLVPIEGTRQGMAKLRGDTFRERTYPGARHEVFNETNRDQVLTDVNEFIVDSLGL